MSTDEWKLLMARFDRIEKRLAEIDDHVLREGTYATSAIEGAERRVIAFAVMLFAFGMVALWAAT